MPADLMHAKFIVVTNCTARKRAGVPLARMSPSATSDDLGPIVDHWRSTLAEQPAEVSAGRLYVGRAISEARRTAEMLDASLFIVSAGLGLVSADRMVPGYDLSASRGVGAGLPGLLQQFGASVADWWGLLNQGRGLSWLLEDAKESVVLLALPAEYLRLLGPDLTELPDCSAARLRIFTSSHGRRVLAHRPDLPIMPYDERLEAMHGFAGTRSDFPQRAMRHFVSRLQAHLLDATAAHKAVEGALAAFAAPVVPVRRRLTDAEIKDLLRRGWRACDGNSARLLRYLRDDLQVACEQGRFAELRRSVAAEFPSKALRQPAELSDVR